MPYKVANVPMYGRGRGGALSTETLALVEEAGINIVVRPMSGFRGARAWALTWEGTWGAVTGSLLMAEDTSLIMDSALVATRWRFTMTTGKASASKVVIYSLSRCTVYFKLLPIPSASPSDLSPLVHTKNLPLPL